MINQRKTELFLYRLGDWISAAIAWFLFFVFRWKVVHPEAKLSDIISDEKLALGLLVIPLGWVILYTIFDKYSDIYRYSRLATLRRTFVLSLTGCLFLFFTVLVDDDTLKYTSYFKPFGVLFCLHFLLTSTIRMSLLTWAKLRLKAGKVRYETIIIGSANRSWDLYNEMGGKDNRLGLEFTGFLDSDSSDDLIPQEHLPKLGSIDELNAVLDNSQIEEVVIALESSDHSSIKTLLDKLYDYKEKVLVKISPDLYDILLGKVKMNHIYGAGLIEIDQQMMSKYEQLIKRLVDIVAAIILIVLCLPLYLFVAIRVKLSSPGPLLFKQERIGKNSRPFQILKFRSMFIDAEAAGPQLSSDHDPRITSFGRVMRKWRLDEIPQFFNLLFGDMSLVGPRPERQFYIDQIISKEPLYKHLLAIRPGITSWGQVKFGYASDVDQMVQRLRYDLIYLENMSLSLDLKILFYTFLILLQGKGK